MYQLGILQIESRYLKRVQYNNTFRNTMKLPSYCNAPSNQNESTLRGIPADTYDTIFKYGRSIAMQRK